jgi:hypothetical protein
MPLAGQKKERSGGPGAPCGLLTVCVVECELGRRFCRRCFCPNAVEAGAAIYGAIPTRQKGNLGLDAAGSAHRGVHLAARGFVIAVVV